MKTILLISPYWKEPHRWMVSSVKLAALWQRMGYRVAAVCMGSKTFPERISETLTVHHVRDFFLRDPLNYGIAPTFLFHVLRALKREKPDIVVVNKVLFWSSLVTPVLRLMGRRPIVTTDTLVGITWQPRGFFPKILMAIGGWTAGWLVLLSAKKVVFFHPQPKALLRVLGVAKKSLVIPTGIDVSAFGSSASPMGSVPPGTDPFPPPGRVPHPRGSVPPGTDPFPPQIPTTREIPNPKSQITVTYVGRLESVKGVDDFLAAAVPLKKRFPMLRIQVVGWYRENHPFVARYRSEVAFTGLRDDIPAVLAGTDIFVLPSYSEGLSNSLMEAMASGCACIATEVGGNRFLIENGVSGFLFPPGDRAALQSHIRRLIEDEPKRLALGRAARARIEKEFSWEVVEERYGKLFAKTSGCS